MTKYCQEPGDNHSTDKFTVWYGRETPLRLCGYHATQFDINTIIERIENAKN